MYTATIAIQLGARKSSQYSKARRGRHVDKGKEKVNVCLCQITWSCVYKTPGNLPKLVRTAGCVQHGCMIQHRLTNISWISFNEHGETENKIQYHVSSFNKKRNRETENSPTQIDPTDLWQRYKNIQWTKGRLFKQRCWNNYIDKIMNLTYVTHYTEIYLNES